VVQRTVKLRIPAGLLTYFAIAFGCGTFGLSILGFFGNVRWYFDLCAHFRFQYLIIFLLLAVTLFRTHRWWAFFFLAGSAISSYSILPLYIGAGEMGPLEKRTLRAVSINVDMNGGDPTRVGELLKKVDPDIILLLEVNDRWLTALDPITKAYPHSKEEPRVGGSGIAFYSKLPIVQASVENLKSPRPSLVVTVEFENKDITIVGTHPFPPVRGWKSNSRNFHFEAISERVRILDQPVLVLGDLNASCWSAPFQQLLETAGLKNSARGFGIQPTWPTWMPLLMIPIDHCLHSPDLHVLDRRVGPNVGSDHLPLFVELAAELSS
jgi:endonuclease/exonuclease/phosphatase (EEP) superfamily protein YafD